MRDAFSEHRYAWTDTTSARLCPTDGKKKDFDGLLNADNHKITSYIVSESHYQHDHMKYDHVFTLSDLYDNKMNLMNLFLFNDGDSVAVIQLL